MANLEISQTAKAHNQSNSKNINSKKKYFNFKPSVSIKKLLKNLKNMVWIDISSYYYS